MIGNVLGSQVFKGNRDYESFKVASTMVSGLKINPLRDWLICVQSCPEKAKSPYEGPGGWDFDFKRSEHHLEVPPCTREVDTTLTNILQKSKITPTRPSVETCVTPVGEVSTPSSLLPRKAVQKLRGPTKQHAHEKRKSPVKKVLSPVGLLRPKALAKPKVALSTVISSSPEFVPSSPEVFEGE